MARKLGSRDKKKRYSRGRLIGLTSALILPTAAVTGYKSAFGKTPNKDAYIKKQYIDYEKLKFLDEGKTINELNNSIKNKNAAALKIRKKHGIRRAGLATALGLAGSIGLGTLAHSIQEQRQKKNGKKSRIAGQS